MKQDIKFRPFISANLLRAIAMILLGIAEIATFLSLYYKISGNLTEELQENLDFYRNLINLSTPFILVTIIANITRDTQKLKKIMFKYLIYALLFYAFEILIFRFFIVPFIEDTFYYVIGVENLDSKEAHKAILRMVSYLIANTANLNTFIDVFICTCFAFFVLYKPNFKKEKSIVIFRSMSALPIIYILASVTLSGFYSLGYITYPIEVGALLIHRSYTCFLFFIIIILYLKYKDMKNKNDTRRSEYIEYTNSNRGLMEFNFTIVFLILILCVLDYFLSFIPNISFFNIGNSYHILIGLPVLLLFNSNRNRHPKLTNLFIGIYMMIIGIILFVIFIFIFNEAQKYIELLAEIIKALIEI